MKKASLYHLSRIFLLAAVAGLIWQLVLVSSIYFSYNVTTRMSVNIPEEIVTESVHLCSRYTDIIDFEKLNSETGRSWRYSLANPPIRKYQHELTISQMFKYTPREEEIISKMWYRSNDSYTGQESLGEDVLKVFKVQKYLYLEYVCYKISYRSNNSFTMPYSYFAVTPTSPGKVYEFFLNKSSLIYRSQYMKIVITNNALAAYPFRSISMASTIARYWNNTTGEPKYNRFKNFKVRITNKLLPAPYITNCFNYSGTGFMSDADCTQACLMEKTLVEFDKVPFSVIINDSYRDSDKHIISYTDITNDTIMHQLLRIQDECRMSLCGKAACSYGIALTETEVIIEPDFRIRLNVPSRAWIYVTANPKLSLVEFVTYVMGIVGSFTGLGVMSCDPAKIMHASVKQLKAFFMGAREIRGRRGTLSSRASWPHPRAGMHRRCRARQRCRSFM